MCTSNILSIKKEEHIKLQYVCIHSFSFALQNDDNKWIGFVSRFQKSWALWAHAHIAQIQNITYSLFYLHLHHHHIKDNQKSDRNRVAKRTHQKLGPLGLMINVVNARQSIYLDVPVREKVFVSFLFIRLLAS